VSVTRAGASLAASPDRARGVTWIGPPAPAGMHPDLTQPDGVQTIGPRRYLVFRNQGITYAEVLK